MLRLDPLGCFSSLWIILVIKYYLAFGKPQETCVSLCSSSFLILIGSSTWLWITEEILESGAHRVQNHRLGFKSIYQPCDLIYYPYQEYEDHNAAKVVCKQNSFVVRTKRAMPLEGLAHFSTWYMLTVTNHHLNIVLISHYVSFKIKIHKGYWNCPVMEHGFKPSSS